MRDGSPIALGYFAVAFTLGIAARNAGLSAIQALIASALNNASAGEYAGFALIAAGSSYLEMAVMTLVVNARYLLMSCALSQKLKTATPLRHRMLIAYDVTDEIFGICVAQPGYLNPWYAYGAIAVAIPGWALGTFFGVIMGNVLPTRVVSALSVGLYGMFLAIIIPPARKNRVIAGVVAVGFAASYLVNRLPLFNGLSTGIKTIALTASLALLAAVLFPADMVNSGEKSSSDNGDSEEVT
ncbi:MAG: AzlC family ABC transporter permease [Lachnospiraceae bacterium]|nr:AzlC family ABC transporter permease [Lachnospiraceae bacterium]MCI9397306.1 AzlC family ABC transporter permease [Lachnospiraceae bacterium]